MKREKWPQLLFLWVISPICESLAHILHDTWDPDRNMGTSGSQLQYGSPLVQNNHTHMIHVCHSKVCLVKHFSILLTTCCVGIIGVDVTTVLLYIFLGCRQVCIAVACPTSRPGPRFAYALDLRKKRHLQLMFSQHYFFFLIEVRSWCSRCCHILNAKHHHWTNMSTDWLSFDGLSQTSRSIWAT